MSHAENTGETHYLQPFSPACALLLRLLSRQPDLLNFLARDTPPLIDRQPPNPRAVAESTKPIDMLNHESDILGRVDVVTGLPKYRVGVVCEKAGRETNVVPIPQIDLLQVAVQAEPRESSRCVWSWNSFLVFAARERVQVCLRRPPSY